MGDWPDPRSRVERHMRHALRLARAGTGATYPNPSVGAVVARGDEVVGVGRSGPAGQAHAEVKALRKAGEAARGATMYVTLEPCRHFGRTPPCTRAIREAGIARVYVSVTDPAPPMRGRGIKELRKAGIETHAGVMLEAGERVHAHYLHHLRTGRPWVSLKVATSIDGRLAAASGDSKWITGEAARKQGHRLRASHHAIAVGAGTVRADDPQLTVRAVRGVDPQPVVFDSKLRLLEGPRRKLLAEGSFIVHTAAAPKALRVRADALGMRRIVAKSRKGRVDIDDALARLGELELRSLMVEGGGELLGAFIAAQAWQELHVFRAPILLGEGRPAFAQWAARAVKSAPRLRRVSEKRLGEDLWSVFVP